MSTATRRVESHHRWATGMLCGSCQAPAGSFEFRNRGSMGSGHGWSMGWGVAWNCSATEYLIQNPPGSANWMIGCIGTSELSLRPFDKGTPNLPEGIVESPGVPVTPPSLYLAQFADPARLLKRLEPMLPTNALKYRADSVDITFILYPGYFQLAALPTQNTG